MKKPITTEVIESLATAADLWGMDSAPIRTSKRRSDKLPKAPGSEAVKITFSDSLELPTAVLRAAMNDLTGKGIVTTFSHAGDPGASVRHLCQAVGTRL